MTPGGDRMLKIYGTREPPAGQMTLRAGPLKAVFAAGGLRGIFYDGHEVLRGISYLVRDENWGTCPARIRNVEVRKGKARFSICYSAVARSGDASLSFDANIEATPASVVFRVSAVPDSDFRTNRTGFVVLHPITGVAGKALTVTHTDGRVERARFPKLISPGQPFFEISALEHQPAPGLKAHVLFGGNKFEMEDQRNWSDASYKTYVCSLLDPWPYLLKAGVRFAQSVTLRISGAARQPKAAATKKRVASFKVPEIGIAIAQDEASRSLKHVKALAQLAPRHLTCTLDGGSDMHPACEAYAALAGVSGIPVTLEVVLPAQEPVEIEMSRVADAVKKAGLTPSRLVVTQAHDLKSFQPTDVRPWGPSYGEMAGAARKAFPGVAVGGGMASYFTELNRKRPPAGVFDFITHSVCPIVHDASDEAVLQTLEALPHIFATAKSFIGKTPYHLGPSSIGARMNPYGADLASNPKSRRVCLAPNDPRQFGRFAVTWNRGVIQAAAEAGLQSVTLSALCGPQGLLDGKGKPSPLFQFLRKIMLLCGKRVNSL